MSKIKVMDESLANKIAAGEVVEKCASVLKELVENSIDAESTNIKVDLIDGGLSGITVIDNGVGMDKDDAVLAFSSHATSKIRTVDDLFFIETLGFRGEALASISAVSEVELDTCNKDVGTHIHIKGGKILEVINSDARIGTKISITNLFYNTPARLKYLKSQTTELNNCISYIEKLALSHPEITFNLTNNGKSIVKTSGANNLLKTIHEIYGINVSSNMLEIKANNDDFEINGYVSKPSVLKKNRNHFHIMINGRVVKNLDINRAINDAYNTYKHDGFYPIVVINIYVDPTLVDVNIHPTKQDVKMSKIEVLTDLLYKTIKDTLYNNLLIPDAVMLSGEEKEEEIPFIEPSIYKEDKNIVQTEMDFNVNEPVEKNNVFKLLKLTPIGQVHGTYIIAEAEDGLYILDQHAVHERINYEAITKERKQEKVYSQDLLIPISIELSTSEYNIFKERMEVLEQLGFKFSEFGINTILVNSHPTWLTSGREEESIKAIIDLTISNDKKFSKDKFIDSVIKMAACKMSIKANERLSIEQMEQLLNDLIKCDNPYNCCHGRPSIMKYSNYDLEKMFKRVI